MPAIIQNTTCFSEHQDRRLTCKKTSCRNWMKDAVSLNCAIIGADEKESRTLQEIGDIFGVTRMRICQIEKNVKQRLQEVVALDYSCS